MIPYGRQCIEQSDIDAVVEVLHSDFLTQGPKVPAFEGAVADRVNARYGFAVNSATSALHLACLALGVGPGDRVWTSPNTFVASANCALYCGATVDFVDIDPWTYNMCAETLAEQLQRAQAEGCLPKVVIPVHFAGQSCDMAEIHALSAQYGFSIIEDASHAIGASYRGEPVGCGRFSDITVFSFHPVKIITTAEGGLTVTNSEKLAQTMALLRSQGVTRDEALMTEAAHGPWYYQQIELGFNYRMTDIQAALGLSQLGRLDQYLSRRHQLASRYDQAFADLPLTCPWQHPDSVTAYHLYPVRIPGREGCGRKEVFQQLRQAGIGVNVHYIPVHLQPYYRRLGFAPGDFPEAEKYYSEAISLPLFPALGEDEQDAVIAAVREVVRT
ncbi:UDP-4-amino-4,6-dideoxy-N-acetyl-beta-L-altrosamine transaminase [Seongchinamella sediminis]|uniref:UDP-4-amino-4, 6-dideoxy-N-acetyl-beta-L-altrosamine transaminase n=1 Tax=Seongchinamella sediminis TaxID=2283635 RepID=A0A3L7E1S2_9GAMM|nr:UDP-4-amino-4,6-dideoxy-N-acetyl-beta-L-altrosamine transaminase [Seongchinamella sediminis]RLQ22221.1 UDP-4-amino-4,6-dideoxy-N-acetyl-beta-L-altrosamine transaminase [Seongchinamella sediminis]